VIGILNLGGNTMTLTRILGGAALASAIAMGMSAPASAAANAYEFAYTYSPNVYGPQQLIINGSIVLNAINEGWYDSTGFHQANNQDYIVGNCSINNCFGDTNYNNFFTFNLSDMRVPITSAVLSLGNPSGGFFGAPSTYTLHDVTTPYFDLFGDQYGATGIYSDLGSGVAYGSTTVDGSSNGNQVNITLNSDALNAIQAVEYQDSDFHLFSLGGTLTSGVPEPAEWAMLLMGFGLIGFAARRRAARPASVAAA
jgi:hypothetical protein